MWRCAAFCFFLAQPFVEYPAAIAAAASAGASAQPIRSTATEICPRPAPGARVAEPPNLRSEHGVLHLGLTIRNERTADGTLRYCYLLADGTQAPTLRLHPGDWLILELKNELIDFPPRATAAAPSPVSTPASTTTTSAAASPASHEHHHSASRESDPCLSGSMSPIATNLHFHGLTVPPRCHQDEVLTTSIQPGDGPFEYRFRIPADEPPGLYWYHPHIHGFSRNFVLGGASGALIIEGLERANPTLAGLPERVFVIRDQDLTNPNAPPARSEPVVPKMMIDRDGDSANNGTGFGKPAKDLSINFVPVPYPDYPPALIEMKPHEKQLWRVLNASAIVYLNLAVVWGSVPQSLGIVAIDGVPLSASALANASPDHIGLPPGARAEFTVQSPPLGPPALLVTRTVDTGAGGENDPNRPLASIVTNDAADPVSFLPASRGPLPPPSRPWLGEVAPMRVRKLYFSEKLKDPNDPNSATDFYLTVDGQTPAAFDPAAIEPNIVVHQGDVEDWIIENRSTELHAFHIHQIHFQLIDWSGVPVNEPFLRDTVNVPYYNGRMLQYPSVRLRMDFRDPDTVGTFVYHCHLLEHEDGGMMGVIRVDPPPARDRLAARIH